MSASVSTSRHIAFDWGGVFTIGTFDGRATQRIADECGLDVAFVRQSYFQHIHQLEVGAWTLEHFWAVLSQEIDVYLSYQTFEKLYLASILENKQMYNFLSRLPQDIKIGLLSNNYPIISDHLKADLRFARFDALIFSNEIGYKKPNAKSFSLLEQAMQLPASQVIFVDDVAENLAAAKSVGFRTLLYSYENHAECERSLTAWLAGKAL